MHVAVAIVGFRNLGDILGCLGALEHSTYQDFEVLICENGGPRAYADLTAALPSTLKTGQPVRAILAPRNLGYGGGVNVCLTASPTADAWWVLNPDTFPDPSAMAALVARLTVGDCDAVGCTMVLPNGMVQSHGGHWQTSLARAVAIGHSTSPVSPVDPDEIERRQNYISGASMMLSRRFLETTGLMREDYFLYCEEVEWCRRGVARGMRLAYAPGARVVHCEGTTTGSGERITERSRLPVYLGVRNQVLVTRDCTPRWLPVAAIGALLMVFVHYGRRGAWRQVGYGLAGWMAGLLNERGAPNWLEV
jgi:hypothetical protein